MSDQPFKVNMVLLSHGDEGAQFGTQENAAFPEGIKLARDVWSGLGRPEVIEIAIESRGLVSEGSTPPIGADISPRPAWFRRLVARFQVVRELRLAGRAGVRARLKGEAWDRAQQGDGANG